MAFFRKRSNANGQRFPQQNHTEMKTEQCELERKFDSIWVLCRTQAICWGKGLKCNNNAVERWDSLSLWMSHVWKFKKKVFQFWFYKSPIDRTEFFKQVLSDDSAENTWVLGKFLTEAFPRHESEIDIPQLHPFNITVESFFLLLFL